MQYIDGKLPPYNIEIDQTSTRSLAKYLLQNGSDALVISGTTGEAPATHVKEKGELIRIVKQVVAQYFPDRTVPLIAGVGSNDTQHVLANIDEAANAGADALLIVSPYYSRPSQEAMVAHFAVCLEYANKAELPVILYDVPSRSGVEISKETYCELAKYPNFVAIKDATGNVENAKVKINAVNVRRRELGLQDVALYAGDDSLLVDFLSAGAIGIISVASHLVGSEFGKVITTFSAGDFEASTKTAVDTAWAVGLCNGIGQQASVTKSAMQALGVIKSGAMRLPNLELNEDAVSSVKEVLAKHITN